MKPTADIVITAPASEFKLPSRIRRNPAKKEQAEFLGLDGLLIKTEMLRDSEWMANRRAFARGKHQDLDGWMFEVFQKLMLEKRADPWAVYVNGIYLVGARPYESGSADDFARKIVTDATMTHSAVILMTMEARPNSDNVQSRVIKATLSGCNCTGISATAVVMQ